jgi:hypothetical protein
MVWKSSTGFGTTSPHLMNDLSVPTNVFYYKRTVFLFRVVYEPILSLPAFWQRGSLLMVWKSSTDFGNYKSSSNVCPFHHLFLIMIEKNSVSFSGCIRAMSACWLIGLGLYCEPSLSSSIYRVAWCLVLLGDLHSDRLLVGGSLARFGGIDSKCGLATMLPPIKNSVILEGARSWRRRTGFG